MKVAAYQAPLLESGSMEAVELIDERVRWCEREGVEILCCPEGILGGLADYAAQPYEIAMDVRALENLLAPAASETVVTIVGFTELADGKLYNSAAVMQSGAVAGVYRKVHPAIRRSIYEPGQETPVFAGKGLTFGILICNDSNFPELARTMARRGARALFIPSNNGLPEDRDSASLVLAARNVDAALATENGVAVIRADVAGRMNGFVSHGSAAITAADGRVLQAAQEFREQILVAEIL